MSKQSNPTTKKTEADVELERMFGHEDESSLSASDKFRIYLI